MTLISLIDMHMHSTASDGASSPAELVRKAKAAGLRFISITDHDSIEGLAEGRAEAEQLGIHFINGVELSVRYKTPHYADGKKAVEIHLLGYGFDPDNAELKQVLDENKTYRLWRARQIVAKVNPLLVTQGHAPIEEEYLDERLRTAEGAFGRPHLANMLVELGIVSSVREAFDRYLIGYDVPKREISFEEGSRLIRAAGGKAVLAHPMTHQVFGMKKISTSLDIHAQVIVDMRPYIDGIECFYMDHTPELVQFYTSLARNYDLIMTGGSDHHGSKSTAASNAPTFREVLGQCPVPDYVAAQFGVDLK